MLTLNDLITSSNSYPDRASSSALTPEVLQNLQQLLPLVNSLLSDIGWTNPKVSSGFRPPEINENITNAAKNSNHMKGLAVDILDDHNQTLGHLCTDDVLVSHKLYKESLQYTLGKNTNWVHLQSVPPHSGHTTFIP
jgi:hypothetical protein